MSTFVEVPAASTQVLKNTGATISITFSAGAADAAVTVLVTNAAGTTVTSGTATHGTGGTYTFVLAPQTDVAALTVKWTGAFGGVTNSLYTFVDVVGALLFTIADARAFGKSADLASAVTYPDQVIADARARITDMFRQYCDVSFIPRYDHWTTDAYYQSKLYLPDKRVTRVLAASVNGVALTSPQLAALVVYPSGELAFNNTYWGFWSGYQRQAITVEYEHGWETPPPAITRAALTVAWADLTQSQLADRFISFQNEFGISRQSTPDWAAGRCTGIPAVDSVLNGYRQGTPLEVC